MEINDKIEQLIRQKSKDRIFPIFNKLDRIWSSNSNLTFCELVKDLKIDNLDDLDLTKRLDVYIDDNNIK